MGNTYDVIVAGVGAMGSSACCHLAARGQKVLGLERFDIPNARGSSHGLTRIIRLAYFEGPVYVPLLRRAYELWHDLGRRFGEPLLITTGSIDSSAEDGRIFTGSLDSSRAHGLAHEVLTGAEANRRFPGFRIPPTHRALFQPEGGFILSERAIVAHVTLAQAAGAEIHARERFLEWSPIAGGGVRVVTDRAVYEAGRLVLSPGAWVADLLPSLKNIAVPERQVLGWFQPSAPEKYTPATFPVTIIDVDEGLYYLLPTWGIPGVKLGRFQHFHEEASAETMSREVTRTDEEELRRCLAAHFPEANGPAMALQSCMFTSTPDERFIIDTLPGHDEVIVASPCSGHGYKFASVIGEILADLATTGKSRFDLSMFRMDRFPATPQSTPAVQ